MIGVSHESRPLRGKDRYSWLRRHSLIGAPQTPNNELSPGKQAKPEGKVSNSQNHSTNAATLAATIPIMNAGCVLTQSPKNSSTGT